MNIAVIDLGTNTFNLLIAKLSNGKFCPLFVTKKFVQLGKGGINKKIIQEDAIQRAFLALTEYKNIAKENNCQKIIAIATSAIRNADNGKEFVLKVKEKLNIDIKTIDGNSEAEYIYKGAREAVDLSNGISLVMDVGGGSTEFIICNSETIFWKQSFEVGAARLKEAFHFTEPISKEEIKQIELHLEQILSPLFSISKKYKLKKVVGCSGAFSSFAAIVVNKENRLEDLKGKACFEFDITSFKNVHNHLVNSTLEQRLAIPGLIAERSPMIVVGSILVNYVLTRLNISNFELSRFALKEGVVFTQLNTMKNG